MYNGVGVGVGGGVGGGGRLVNLFSLRENIGQNLPKTLSCVGYDKFQNPHGDKPTPALVSMKILKIQSFGIATQLGFVTEWLV